jgi:hypothetical protein
VKPVPRPLAALANAAAVALVAAGAIVGQRRAREAEVSPLPSVDSTAPRGLAAAWAFLAATRRPAVRLSSPEDAPPPGAVVLLAAPAAALDGAEADALLAHVRAGGTLLWMAGRTAQPALVRRLDARALTAGGERIATALAPHPLFAGLSLPVSGGLVMSGREGAIAVAGGESFTSAVSIPLGAGEAILLTGSAPLSNARLGEGDAASFLVRLAARGPIAFDERWLLPRDALASQSRTALALAVLGAQAVLAAAVFVAARARRLGAIRPPPPEARGRTARDYLASLAALYRRAGAEDELARAAWAALRRELERRAGIPARLPAAEARALLARRSAAAVAAAEALGRGDAALARGGRGALLAVTRAAADVERALGGGGAAAW